MEDLDFLAKISEIENKILCTVKTMPCFEFICDTMAVMVASWTFTLNPGVRENTIIAFSFCCASFPAALYSRIRFIYLIFLTTYGH